MSAKIKQNAVELLKCLAVINAAFGLACFAYLCNHEPAYGYFGVHDNVVAAAREGDLRQVRFLSAFDGMLSRTGFEEHYTPLTGAVRWKRTNVVRFLLQKGVDVHSKDDFNRTALSLAREDGNQDIIRFLVQSGAKY